VFVVLLSINLLFALYTAFLQFDVYSLEQLKAGGYQNMRIAKQLYSSDVYIEQQRATLEQILQSMHQEVDLSALQANVEQ
jgi:hypothetical protein